MTIKRVKIDPLELCKSSIILEQRVFYRRSADIKNTSGGIVLRMRNILDKVA